MKPLVDEGKIYKALPPLYLFDPKSAKKYISGNEWAFDKNEYYHMLNTVIANNVDVMLVGDEEAPTAPLKKAALMDWLNMNAEYLLELDSLEKRTVANPIILEHVCYYKLISADNSLRFKELIEDTFTEIKYDIEDESLSGSYNAEFVSLITDKLFMKISRRFMKTLAENPSFYVAVRKKKDTESDYTKLTVGTFLLLMRNQYDIKILQRFKGLGEAQPNILFMTTMNPKLRKLIRMTASDCEETLKIFDLLHGRNSEMREQRRQLLDNAEISYADIDN